MIYKTAPEDFDTRGGRDVVGCYVMHHDRFLLLKRQHHKPSGGHWGLPAGKCEPHETTTAAMLRELQEETGIIASLAEISHVATVFVRNEGRDFIYHMFVLNMETEPAVRLSPEEHLEYRFVSREESETLDLVHDQHECTDIFYSRKS